METREVQDKRRTASFAASAEGTKVVFSENYKYYHFRNDGGGTVYVSAYPDVGEGVDGTKSIADGGCGYVFSCDDHVFVKGAAKITVEASNLPECPFKSAQRGGDITAKGNPVQLDSLQGGVPFSEMVVSGDNIIGQDLTVNVSGVSGKNLFDGNLIIGMVQTSTGIMTGGAQYLSTPNYISVNGDCTYSLSNFENKQFDAVVFYDSNKSYISATPLNRVEPLISHFTTPQNCKYIRWRYLFDNGASIDMLTNIQLELGDTATAYEPYHGSTTTITPDSNPYVIPNDIRQQDGLNNISVSAGTLSVTGVRKNAAIKRIWDEIDEIKTAIIVSNGESE